MAKRLVWPDKNDPKIRRDTTTIHIENGAPYSEMKEWLEDSSRPGYWFAHHMGFSIAGSKYKISISDPDVAFEFKMRWV